MIAPDSQIPKIDPALLRWARFSRGLFFPWALVAALFVGAAIAHAFLGAREYTATARLLPPFGEQDSLSVLSGAAGGLPSATWWEPEDTNEANFITMGVLKSDRVLDLVIARGGVTERRDLNGTADARRWLRSATDIVQDRHKLIVLKVTTGDPDWSAELANQYLGALEETQRNLRASYQSYRLQQVRQRATENNRVLREAESAFQTFKERHGMVHAERQAQATVDLMARLEELEAEEKVDLSGDGRFLADQHSSVARSRARLETLDDLQRRLAEGGVGKEERHLPGIAVLPALQREFGDLEHKVALGRENARLLTRQIEVLEVFEAGNFPESTVLDRALAPDCDSGPGASKLVAIALVMSLFLYFAAIAGCDLALHFLPAYALELTPLRAARRLAARVYRGPAERNFFLGKEVAA